MTPERWDLVKKILEGAWQHDEPERAAYLEQACGGDLELQARVEALLSSDERAGQFLISPAIPSDTSRRDLVRQAIAEPAPPESTDGSEWIGKRIGRYTVTGLIGKGGMGAVYRAFRDDDFQMQVAIKVLRQGTDTEDALTRFRTERQILAGLQHPNIARLIDGGATDDGLPYLAMEYVEGTPLLTYAASLPVQQRLQLFRSVCSAVQHAHQSKIVHRDIKPANILVTFDGVPKLLDFGIAKLLHAGPGIPSTLTGTGVAPMTPAYASPEQIRGEDVKTSTDVYSLGAVLYELLTGRRAHEFEGRSQEVMEEEICSHPPVAPSKVAPGLDPDLDYIVLMALRPQIQRRYTSVEQFSDDLDRFLQDLPVQARPNGSFYRLRKFVKRNRTAAIAASVTAALAVALILLGRFSFNGRQPSGADRSIAVLPFENTSGDKEQEYFVEGITDALIGELSQMPGLRVIS